MLVLSSVFIRAALRTGRCIDMRGSDEELRIAARSRKNDPMQESGSLISQDPSWISAGDIF